MTVELTILCFFLKLFFNIIKNYNLFIIVVLMVIFISNLKEIRKRNELKYLKKYTYKV